MYYFVCYGQLVKLAYSCSVKNMLAIDIITDEIPPLKTSDVGTRALVWMDEFKVSHLPVLEGRSYYGLLSEANVMDLSDPESSIGEAMDEMERPFVFDSQHIFDVIKLMGEEHLSVVPVIDDKGIFLGAISIFEVIKQIGNVSGITDPGSVVILEMPKRNYSLHEIAKIVEENEARILSSFSHSAADLDNMEVTLKIDRAEISGILQSFERWEIRVKASFQGSQYQEDLQDRYEELMKYINM